MRSSACCATRAPDGDAGRLFGGWNVKDLAPNRLPRSIAALIFLITACAPTGGGDTVRPNTTGETASRPANDNARGEVLFRKCVSCHSLKKNGRNKVGPRPHGLFGRISGSVADYKYSRALGRARIVWNEDTLDAYLADTTGMVPGTKMYAYMSRERDRADLIAFLRAATGTR